MYFDLFIPFPIPESAEINIKGKNKGKNKAPPPAPVNISTSCWEGISTEDKEVFARRIGLAGHLGFNVVAPTIVREPETQAYPYPFATLPFPHLDPRFQTIISRNRGNGQAGPSKNPVLVQVTRYHVRLDDAKSNPLVSANTSILKHYDILSCQPTNDKALQLACTDLSNPGPNQLSIITLPLHERPYHFRLNRKQIKQAQRNGVVLEILYSAGLFPTPSTPPETVRRYRQNWMSNAREIVRITGGKGIILSSGPGGGPASVRGPADLINLATMLGMPANVAKDCVGLNGKMVLLRAQARRTYKAVLSMPILVPPPEGYQDVPSGQDDVSMEHTGSGVVESTGAGTAEQGGITTVDAGGQGAPAAGNKRPGEAGAGGVPKKKSKGAKKGKGDLTLDPAQSR